VIHLAKITTQVHEVFDVFYVTDESGAKVSDPEQLAHVRDALVEQLRLLSVA
jgi:UTP:GlnB (protein PII) uridylyltransferase